MDRVPSPDRKPRSEIRRKPVPPESQSFLAGNEKGNQDVNVNVKEGSSRKPSKKRGVRRLVRAYSTLLLVTAIPCCLVLLGAGLVLGLVFANRVTFDPGLPELQTSSSASGDASTSLIQQAQNFVNTGGSHAIYIRFNPSSLSTVASLTGKIIPYLSSAMMGLAAYFTADYIRNVSRAGQHEKLLAPKQMTLLLGLLSGKLQYLYDVVDYKVKTRRKLTAPLPFAVTALVVITILSLIIPALDTWFGVVITPSEQTQLHAISPAGRQYGRGLITGNDNVCTNPYLGIPCNLEDDMAGDIFIGGSDAFKIINNISTTDVVSELPAKANSSQPLFFLRDVASSTDVDYKAQSFAMSTQCLSITSKCHVTGDFNNFTCTPGFTGSMGNAFTLTTGIMFFNDSELTTQITLDGLTVQNPMFFGIYAEGQLFSPSTAPQNWFLNCTSTLYEVTYTWVNGAVADYNITMANATVAGLVEGPFIFGYGADPLQNAGTLAALVENKDRGSVTATSFSQSGLAMAIGGIDGRTNLLEQSRTIDSLTRVPVIPLAVLIAFKLLYVLVAVLCAICVVLLANPAESDQVRSELSLEGLAVMAFGSEEFRDQSLEGLETLVNKDGDRDEEESVNGAESSG